MNILLIQPNSRTTRGLVAPPLGLMSIAPLPLQKGFNVSILDANYETGFIPLLKQLQPDIIGVSTLTGPMLLSALELSTAAKQLLGSSVKIVWGGIHASYLPEQVLQESCVDYVIIGEGEFAFLELVELINRGGSPDDYRQIRGLAFKQDNTVVINDERELITDLDSLPFPAWELVDARRYLNFETPIVTSRGCPSGCTFCYNQFFNKRKWRAMSAKRVVDYIAYLDTLSPIKRLKFYDDNASVNKERLIRILSSVRKVPIFCELRPDYVTEDFIKLLLRYSSDPYLFVGIESGSQKMLDYLHKGLTIKQVTDAFTIFHKYHIPTSASFMIGLPHETKEDVNMTVHFVDKLRPTRYTCCLYVPFPGSPLYNQVVKEGLFTPPQSTREWGARASLENARINVSDVNPAYLEKVYRRMYIKSIWTFLKKGRMKTILAGFGNLIDYYRHTFFNPNHTPQK